MEKKLAELKLAEISIPLTLRNKKTAWEIKCVCIIVNDVSIYIF